MPNGARNPRLLLERIFYTSDGADVTVSKTFAAMSASPAGRPPDAPQQATCPRSSSFGAQFLPAPYLHCPPAGAAVSPPRYNVLNKPPRPRGSFLSGVLRASPHCFPPPFRPVPRPPP